MFPTQRTDISYYGIFVQDQIDAIAKNHPVAFDVFAIDGFKSKINYLSTIPKIIKTIKNGSYDLIHIHYALSGLFLLAPSFLYKRPPTLITFHGGDILLKQRKYLQVLLSRLVAKKADKLIVLNQEMSNEAKSLHKPTVRIPCGVDETFFLNNRTHQKSIRILFGGDPSRWVKNYPLFQKIIERYKEKHDSVETLTLGRLNREQVKVALESCSLLILTSHSEGSPQIIKEALCCDTPIMSSDVGDVSDILAGVPGTRIFSPHDTPDYISSMIDSTIKEASVSIGARRKRILELGLDNTSIAMTVYKEYRSIIKDNG